MYSACFLLVSTWALPLPHLWGSSAWCRAIRRAAPRGTLPDTARVLKAHSEQAAPVPALAAARASCEVKECVDREEVRQKLPTSQGCLYEASVWFPQRQSRCHGLCLQMKIRPRCWETITPKECASSRMACFPSLGHQEADVIRRWPSHFCAAAVMHWCGVAKGRLSVMCGVC